MVHFKDIFSPSLNLLTLAILRLAATLLLHVSGTVAALPLLVFGGLTALDLGHRQD